MQADAKTEAEVKARLNEFAQAYAQRDKERLLACLAPDPDVVMVGTGLDEKRIGIAEIQAQVERDWTQAEALSITYKWMSIGAAGQVAWAAIDANFEARVNGTELSFPARITVVLEKRGEQWLVVQSHASFPAAGQEEGQSIPS